MPRFFADLENFDGEEIKIFGDDAYHIARSLRMAVGDSLTVSLGDGDDCLCELLKIRDDECVLKVLEKKPSRNESPVSITLFMAYPKGDKLETVVQKSVELGASQIVPFESSRCIKRPPKEKMEKITDRLNKIAKEAGKQSGRAKLPSVLPMKTFSEVENAIADFDLALLLYENEKKTNIKEVLEKYRAENGTPKTLAVIVGSEGGFSEDEMERIVKSGAFCVTLGGRILRCETAPDYALSVISYNFEL